MNFVDPSGMSLFGTILGGVEDVAGAVGIGIAIAAGGPPLLVATGIAIGALVVRR